MEYTGLLHKYPVNRALTPEERRDQLKQKQRLEGETAYQLSVIRMNSTFMELVDKFYGWKGALTTALLLIVAVLCIPMLVFAVKMLLIGAGFIDAPDFVNNAATANGAGLILVTCVEMAVIVWLLRKESFAYTHYPIRLNRKTRMVHVFRLNGTVLSVPWDEVFFCLRYCRQGMWDIQGHVLDKDGETVRETFSLSVIGTGKVGQRGLRMFWEFVRRYMEEGPAEAVRVAKTFLPIAERRERVIDGFRRMHAEASEAPYVVMVLFALIALVMAPGRWFAMRTSKVPYWPAEIDAVCVVEPNDPFVRGASSNPDDLQ